MTTNNDDAAFQRNRADELEQTLDLMIAAQERAIKAWQQDTGRTMEWPDYTKLVSWLLERGDLLEQGLLEMQDTVRKVIVSFHAEIGLPVPPEVDAALKAAATTPQQAAGARPLPTREQLAPQYPHTVGEWCAAEWARNAALQLLPEGWTMRSGKHGFPEFVGKREDRPAAIVWRGGNTSWRWAFEGQQDRSREVPCALDGIREADAALRAVPASTPPSKVTPPVAVNVDFGFPMTVVGSMPIRKPEPQPQVTPQQAAGARPLPTREQLEAMQDAAGKASSDSETSKSLRPREIAYSGDWQFTYSYDPKDHYVEWFQREDAGYQDEDEDWELTASVPAVIVGQAARWIEANTPSSRGSSTP